MRRAAFDATLLFHVARKTADLADTESAPGRRFQTWQCSVHSAFPFSGRQGHPYSHRLSRVGGRLALWPGSCRPVDAVPRVRRQALRAHVQGGGPAKARAGAGVWAAGEGSCVRRGRECDSDS